MSFLKSQDVKEAEEVLKAYGKFIRSYKDKTENFIEHKNNSAKYFRLKNSENPENLSCFELLASENKPLSKVLIVFYHLNKESKKLIKAAREIANNLILIEDEIISLSELEENSHDPKSIALAKFSYSLEDLVNMKFLVQNAIYLKINVIQQYCALYSAEKFLHILPSSHFPSNIDDIVLILKSFMIFDLIFRNGIYKSYLHLYCELLQQQQQQHQPETSEDDDRHKTLLNTLHELDLLLDGNIFQLALDNLVGAKSRVKMNALKHFENLLSSYIKNTIYGINVFNYNISELNDVDEIFKLNIAIVMYQHLFNNLDSKVLKSVIEINQKYPALIIEGNIMWNGSDFLKTFIPSLEKTNMDLEKIQQNYMSIKSQNIIKDSLNYPLQVR
jgi:hypothetical protein